MAREREEEEVISRVTSGAWAIRLVLEQDKEAYVTVVPHASAPHHEAKLETNSRAPFIYDRTCTRGHYCPAGSADPVDCVAGTYQNDTGASDCDICPARYYCEATTTNATLCPAGYFCPEGTEFATEFPCPNGTYANETGLAASTECTLCPPGRCVLYVYFVLRTWDGYIFVKKYLKKKTKHQSCEIEGFVETRPCDLRVYDTSLARTISYGIYTWNIFSPKLLCYTGMNLAAPLGALVRTCGRV